MRYLHGDEALRQGGQRVCLLALGRVGVIAALVDGLLDRVALVAVDLDHHLSLKKNKY